MTEEKNPEEKPVGEKFKEKMKDFDINEKLDDVYRYSVGHKLETTGYVLMALGLLLCLFDQLFLGELLLGLVVGYFFSTLIYVFFRGYSRYLQLFGTFKAIVFGAGLLGLFIAAPMFFVGVAIAVLVSKLAGGSSVEERKKPDIEVE